jgi:hypothetical protein
MQPLFEVVLLLEQPRLARRLRGFHDRDRLPDHARQRLRALRRCMTTATVGRVFHVANYTLTMMISGQNTMPDKVIPIRNAVRATQAAPRFDGGPLADTRGRPMRDLRISVTDRCNFRCTYCMPREVFDANYKFPLHEAIPSFGRSRAWRASSSAWA